MITNIAGYYEEQKMKATIANALNVSFDISRDLGMFDKKVTRLFPYLEENV